MSLFLWKYTCQFVYELIVLKVCMFSQDVMWAMQSVRLIIRVWLNNFGLGWNFWRKKKSNMVSSLTYNIMRLLCQTKLTFWSLKSSLFFGFCQNCIIINVQFSLYLTILTDRIATVVSCEIPHYVLVIGLVQSYSCLSGNLHKF